MQEDLFYVQPTNSITFDESPPREPDSELRQTGCSVRQRDVRFSSPLDSHQPKHAAEKIKKSNPRKGTAASSAPNRSRADLSDSYRELASKKGPTVIVYPVSPKLSCRSPLEVVDFCHTLAVHSGEVLTSSRATQRLSRSIHFGSQELDGIRSISDIWTIACRANRHIGKRCPAWSTFFGASSQSANRSYNSDRFREWSCSSW